MNYYRLSNDITDVVIEALQYFEHIDKNGPPQTFEEATKSISGGIERYRSDPIFRAKVQMLVSRITATVKHNATLTRGAQVVDEGDAGSPSR